MEEKTLKKLHPSRLAFGRSYILSFILLGAGVVAIFNPLGFDLESFSPYAFYGGAGSIVLSFLVAGLAEFRMRTDTYTITDYRVMESSGLFSIKESSIHWNRIANVNLHQSFIKRLSGIGTITIESTGGDDKPEIVMKDIFKAHDAKKLIDEKMLEKASDPEETAKEKK